MGRVREASLMRDMVVSLELFPGITVPSRYRCGEGRLRIKRPLPVQMVWLAILQYGRSPRGLLALSSGHPFRRCLRFRDLLSWFQSCLRSSWESLEPVCCFCVVAGQPTPAVIRDGFLWTCQAIGLKGTNGVHTGGSSATNMDRSGIQWLKFAVSTNTWTLSFSDHGRIYDPAATNPMYYYVPSLMVNSAGDVLAGFSGSSTNVYISAYYDWHLANGSTLAMPVSVQAGSANWDNPTQWGDYSATMLDPSDERTFWTVQAYTDSSQHRAQPWATVIGRILPP